MFDNSQIEQSRKAGKSLPGGPERCRYGRNFGVHIIAASFLREAFEFPRIADFRFSMSETNM